MSDQTTTRRALLDAGRREFSHHGLAGGRIDRIALLAGVNKQRIYAYFGSKENLFEAVLEDCLSDLFDLVPLPAGPSGPTLAAYVGAVAQYHLDHPDLIRLVQWESLESPGEAVLDGPRAAIYRHKVVSLANALNLSQPQAASLLIQLILLAAGPQAMSRLTALVLGQNPDQAVREATTASVETAVGLLRPGTIQTRP
jgi:AcrR family transcriptional regulator